MNNFNTAAVLEEVVARQQIGLAIARLQRGLDRGDAALLSSAFHDDAELDYGFFVGGAADFCALMTGDNNRAPHQVTMHRPTNLWIRVNGAEALSESNIFAYSPGTDGAEAVQSMIGGRYLDRHERRGGVWRLSHRTYVLDWNMNWPGTGSTMPGFGAGLIRGASRDGDPGLRLLADWAISEQPQTNGGATMEVSQALAAQAEVAFARHEIHDLIVAQARAVDRADEALLRSLWHPGASVELGAYFSGTADDFCGWILELARSAARMSHSVANQWIQVDGASAVSETYVIAMDTQAVAGNNRDALTGGRYLDRFECINGTWKFSHRTFVHDWQIESPTTDQSDDPEGMYAALRTRGGLYPDDPVYAFWSQ